MPGSRKVGKTGSQIDGKTRLCLLWTVTKVFHTFSYGEQEDDREDRKGAKKGEAERHIL